MDNVIYYGGKFTKVETLTQYLKNFMLFLYVGGFDFMRVTYPSGAAAEFPELPDSPLLALFPPGSVLDFATNAHRENWAIVFDWSDLSFCGNHGICTVRQAELRPFLRLNAAQLEKVRNLFAEVCRNSAAGHQAGVAKADLLLGAILAELIAGVPEEKSFSPAAALKAAMDKDERFTQTIGELNARLGLGSPPCMRKLFREEYGVLPGEYRSRQRMNRILELFSQTDASLKVIADEVGMKHLPHLYAFLKERQELSPKELLLQFRGRKCSNEGAFSGKSGTMSPDLSAVRRDNSDTARVKKC